MSQAKVLWFSVRFASDFLLFSFFLSCFFNAAARVAFLDCAVESEVVDRFSLFEFIRILVCLGCYSFVAL